MIWFAATALLLYGLLAWLATKALYYPLRYPIGEWESGARAGARDIQLTTSDGVRLHAWWFPFEGSQLATLHLHGNAGNLSHRLHLVEAIHSAGSSLLLLDYRGYGKSEGKPSEHGLYRDGEAAYDWLTSQGWHPDRIILHGESLGTAVGVDIAARRPCAGLILEAPFTSAKAVAGKVLPGLGPLLIWGFDSKSKITRVKAPLLIIHGTRDEILDFSFGRELFDLAKEPKTFWALEGATHNDVFDRAGAEYVKRLREFYSKLLSK